MFPDAASIADQYERDHDPEYRCPICGKCKSPTCRYCGRCARRRRVADADVIPFDFRSVR